MFRVVSILFVTVFFITSCGLKTFYIIEPPTNAQANNPSDGTLVSSPVLSNEYVFTARDLSSSVFINPGTDVYYRIYKSQDDLQEDAERINDLNEEDTNNAFRQLDSLGYKKIESTQGGQNSLINSRGGTVLLRLVDMSQSATITVSGVSTNYIPQRWDDSFFNFDQSYNHTNELYSIPEAGDADFESDSSSSDSFMYINAYAVSVGMDATTFNLVQSELLSLGFNAYEVK